MCIFPSRFLSLGCSQSLAMSLSALRIRIVITYLHSPKHSLGLEPSADDKEVNKRQCELYITNALQVKSPVSVRSTMRVCSSAKLDRMELVV